MKKLTKIILEVTDEQFKALDSAGFFNQSGALFESCSIMAVVREPPVKKTIRDVLLVKQKEQVNGNSVL